MINQFKLGHRVTVDCLSRFLIIQLCDKFFRVTKFSPRRTLETGLENNKLGG